MYKVCSKCGQEFQCTADERCWCHEIEIDDLRLAELKSCGNDCFCKNCLLEIDSISEN